MATPVAEILRLSVVRMRNCLPSDRSRSLDLLLEPFQQPGPAAIDIPAHRLARFRAHLLEVAVFEFHARRVRAVGNEPHLHLGADGRIRLPPAVDVPSDYETFGRFPNDDLPNIRPRTILR